MRKIILGLVLGLFTANANAGEFSAQTTSITDQGILQVTPGFSYQSNSMRGGITSNAQKLKSLQMLRMFKHGKRLSFGLGVQTGYRVNKYNIVGEDYRNVQLLIAAKVKIISKVSVFIFNNKMALEFDF